MDDDLKLREILDGITTTTTGSYSDLEVPITMVEKDGVMCPVKDWDAFIEKDEARKASKVRRKEIPFNVLQKGVPPRPVEKKRRKIDSRLKINNGSPPSGGSENEALKTLLQKAQMDIIKQAEEIDILKEEVRALKGLILVQNSRPQRSNDWTYSSALQKKGRFLDFSDGRRKRGLMAEESGRRGVSLTKIDEETSTVKVSSTPIERGSEAVVASCMTSAPGMAADRSNGRMELEEETGLSEQRTLDSAPAKRRRRVARNKNLVSRLESERRMFEESGVSPRKRRMHRTSVVILRSRVEGISHNELLRKARREIDLPGLGIESTRIRYSMDGAVMIELPGPEKTEKANILASKLRAVLRDEASITRPVMAMGEVRLVGLDRSVDSQEIVAAIVRAGRCNPAEVKVGIPRSLKSGLSVVWVRCPLVSASALARVGRIGIGWTMAKVELLEARPMRCFKCWKLGHLKNECKEEVDRSCSCFRCGCVGHQAHSCESPCRCLICADAGLASNHRFGSERCTDVRVSARRMANGVSRTIDAYGVLEKGIPPLSEGDPSLNEARSCLASGDSESSGFPYRASGDSSGDGGAGSTSNGGMGDDHGSSELG